MDIIALRQNMVSCEGGDPLVVTVDCESPSWVPCQSPGLRQGRCGSLPGVPSGSWEGSWSFLIAAATTGFERQGGERAASFSPAQKVPSEPEYVRRLFLENTRDRESFPSHSPWGAQQQELEGFCAPCIAVSIACFPSPLPRGWDLAHHHATRGLLDIRTGAARAAGPVFPPRASRTDCKHANCKRTIYYRVPYPGEILFFVSFQPN